MRIIGGEYGGRKLVAPRGMDTRPTADRVKEAMFSMLVAAALRDEPDAAAFEGLRVLDLYAGSGALGIEALSRGAAHAVFVEQNRPALAALNDNLERIALTKAATILPAAVARSLDRIVGSGPYDLALVDPPYADVASGTVPKLLSALLSKGALKPGARLLLEHATRDASPTLAGATLDRSRAYGDTTVSLYVVG